MLPMPLRPRTCFLNARPSEDGAARRVAVALLEALIGGVLLGGALTGVPADAEAQAWLGDRQRTEGPGFRLGDFELHPGIGAEIGYDSNLYMSADAGPQPRVETGVLRVTPHLVFSTIGEERRESGESADGSGSSAPTVTFRGGLSASYNEFFAAPSRRNVAIDASLRLNVLPERPFSFSLFNNFSRAVRPFTEDGVDSTARDSNEAGVDFNFQTTGGIFQVGLGYAFGLQFFEGASFQYGNSFTHRIHLTESFSFLPSTAVVQDNQFEYTDYSGATADSPTLLADSARIRTRVGLNGAITEAISLTGMVGYAAGFFYNTSATYAQEYDSLVVTVEGRWQINPDIRLSVGYDRDFYAAFLGNYYSRDRGYLSFQALVAGAFLLGVEGDVGYLDYGVVVSPTGAPVGDRASREDIRVTGRLFAEYRFTDWLGLNLAANYMGNFTDFQYLPMGGIPLDPASYNRFELTGGVRVFY